MIRNIYCTLIKDLFKNLDTINSSQTTSGGNQTDPSKMQRASTIIIQQNRNMLPLLQLNVKSTAAHQQQHQHPATPSKASQKSVTSYLKKAHTLAQNSSSKQQTRGHIPVSNSMKNLARIKAHMSSNSLSTLATASGAATGTASTHSSHAGHYRQEIFKRVFRNHSSSVESPTTPASPPIVISAAGTTQVPALPSPKSPKILIKQTTKVNLNHLLNFQSKKEI